MKEDLHYTPVNFHREKKGQWVFTEGWVGVITKLKEGEKEKEGEWKKLYSFYKEDVRERASKLYNGFSFFYKAELGRGGLKESSRYDRETRMKYSWGCTSSPLLVIVNRRWEGRGYRSAFHPPMESLVFKRGCKLWTRLEASRNRISDKFLGKLEGTWFGQINHGMKRGWMEIKFRAVAC